MKNKLTLLALIFSQILYAQRLIKSGEKILGGSEDDAIFQSVQTNNGNIYAVGETFSDTKGGSDGYLVILNPLSNEVIERRFGGEKNDVFYGIAALADGTFVLVGSTKSKGSGRSDAWIVYVDKDGKSIKEERTYGTSGDDVFRVAVASDDGSVLLSGFKNDQKDSDLWLVKEQNGKTVFDKQLQFGGYIKTLKSGVSDTEGGLVLVGDTKKTNLVKGEDIWVCRFDKMGNATAFNKRYGEPTTYEEANQIIKTSDGGYAIGGMTDNSDGKKMNAWLLKLDESGNMQWQENYGGRDLDFATSVVQTPNEDYVLSGSSLSQTHDSRTRQIYLVRTNSSGKKIWEEYDGGKQDDDGSSIIALYEGSLGLFSNTYSKGKGGKDVWFYRFKTNEDNIEQAPFSENTFRFRDWKIGGADVLEVNQKTFLTVNLTNTTPYVVKNVQLKLKSPVSEITVPTISYLGFIKKNEVRRLSFPISSAVGLLENQYLLEGELIVDNKPLPKFNISINVKRGQAKTVFIHQLPIAASDTAIRFVIENPSETTTKNLSIIFELPPNLVSQNQDFFKQIEPLPAGKTKELTLRFNPNTEGGRLKASVTCLLSEKEILRDKAVFDIKPRNIQNQGTILRWHTPDEYTMNKQNIIANQAEFAIRLNIDSDEPIQKERIKIVIDEKPLENSKMDVADLTPPAEQDNLIRQIYSTILTFNEPKIYHVRVDLTTSKGMTASSSTLIIRYDPEKPNLHILSLGTTSRDLKYPPKDAHDFATVLEKQSSNIFKKIYVTQLTDSIQTTKRGIRSAFLNLKRRYENSGEDKAIAAKDYLVVFISSHGKTSEDNNFKLLPSDYDPSDEDGSAADYKTDALAILEKVQCHKLIFIDACHSGAARGSKANIDSEILMKLSLAARGTTTITSCRSNELSYEDDIWQNGAFTEALIEAFTNKTCTDEVGTFSSDKNDNRQITIGEIYDFIKRRVPNLVKLQKSGRVTEQNPVLTQNELDLDLPIISY